ncbi:MAG: 16S rRNA (cytosine(967)-C(5))-methyltransferase RsmB [Limnochordia bacterium]
MAKVTNPRQLAVLTLNKLEKTEDFLREVLDSHLRQNSLSSLDQGLYTELVYGTVRMRRSLDYVLSLCSSRPLAKIKPEILNVLRSAVYQILYLDRVPARAAVHEAVNLARLFGHEGLAKFTNGILRQVVRRRGSIPYPDQGRDLVRHLGVKYSFPDWIVEHWLDWLGKDETVALCQALNEPPRLQIRVNTLKHSPEEVQTYLEGRGLSVKPGQYAPDILEVSPAHLAVRDQGLEAGMYYVQDESSALAAHALQAEPGQTVYDLCSAPGGKATHLAQLMGNEGKILAFDISPNRLRLVEENARRLGAAIIETRVGNAAENLQLPPAPRVLVDAPCSGLGTMGHRPDIRWRKELGDIEELAALQRQILAAAARYVVPGGLLLYSTCTLTSTENQAVADWFLASHGDFQGYSFPDWFPASAGPAWMKTILPHRHGLDGFFLAIFRKI